MMLEGEINSEKERSQAKDVAIAEGNHEASQLFEKTMHDERRHTAEIKSVLSKLKEKG
jgi:rubrerythrin